VAGRGIVSDRSRPDQAPRIRLAIVDDHPLFGQGLASLLVREPDLEVVGLGTSLSEAAALLDAPDPPDVLLLDVKLGEESGLDLLPRVRSSRTAVVVLTAYDYAPYLAAAHRLGAAGFVARRPRSGSSSMPSDGSPWAASPSSVDQPRWSR
jgi:DNA-binding NarL/FixJ family response regulator